MKYPSLVAVMVTLVVALAAPVAAEDYVVVEGDSLSLIAQRHDTSVADLVERNGLGDADRIQVGQTLVVGPVDPGETTSAATFVYTIERGDSLSAIAARFGVDVTRLAVDNGIADPDLVLIGTDIVIPASAPSAPEPEPDTAHLERYYTVQPGDSLSSVATRFGVDVVALEAANELTDPDLVVVGDRLRIPVEGASSDEIRSLLDHWAGYYGVPTDLFRALTWFESGWNNTLVSSAGAIGIGQLMPSTARWVAEDLIAESLDPFVVEDNIRMSARFLSYLLDQLAGDERLAVAAYYQGLHAVAVHGIYPSSVSYVDGILSLRNRI
ncbi:MAG: LysM peptidoglycan-binding domain-containing protein [Acidimicrobiales bacterium]